jgi:hypothetical protein
MESLKRAIGSGGDEGGGTTTWFGELTGASNESCCPSLSYKQVLIILCLLIDYYANYSVIFIIENGKNIYFFIFALENYWHCRMRRRCICADYGRKYKQYCLYSRVINFAISRHFSLPCPSFSVFSIVSVTLLWFYRKYLQVPSVAIYLRIWSTNSTSFLIGPLKQLKSMFQASRVISTLLFFIALGLTLFSAVYVSSTFGNILALTSRLTLVNYTARCHIIDHSHGHRSIPCLCLVHYELHSVRSKNGLWMRQGHGVNN